MSEPNKAVFLSYASQDAEAARKICEALRSGGVEVWFDVEGGLEHGDEWDAKIRRQIKECVLFIPLISAATQARHEGYFRIEWELASERAMGIAAGVPFILPVVIDGTREPDALVPDRFRRVQWTRLPGGVVPEEVKQRFVKLWSQRTSAPEARAASSPSRAPGFVATRGLAAILFTDVVGYSARVQRDERGTLALVEADFAFMRERCAAHEGEVLNSMGDGLLLCFPSAVQAVSCALQIQAEFGRRREKLPPEQALEHRMGVHIGDVIRQDSGVAGDGVNIAARLEGKAPPGGVCISQIVHDTVHGKVPMQSVFLGSESFKNITHPIPVWHIAPEGGATLSRPPMAVGAPGARKRSRRWLVAGLGVVLLGLLGAGGYFGYRWYFRKQETAVLAALNMLPDPPVEKNGRVLVVRLENRTGSPALDRVGQLAADHVRRRITELDWVKEALAVPEGDRLKPEATEAEMQALARKTGGDLLVTGDYYLEGGRVWVTGRVFDLKRGRIHAEMAPLEGDAAAPAALIEDVAERLVGVSGSVPRARLGRSDVAKSINLSLPRRYDAVQIIDRGPDDDWGRFRRSYERDPKGSLVALVMLAARLTLTERYAEADRLVTEIEAAGATAPISAHGLEMLNWVRATVGGDAGGVEKALDELCRLQPSNRLWRAERIYALYRANKPRAILQEFAAITPGSPGERVAVIWYARAVASFLLEDYAQLAEAGRRAHALDGKNDQPLQWIACAAVMRGDLAEAQQMLDAYDGVGEKSDLSFNLYVTVLATLRRTGRMDSPEFAQIVRRAEAWFASRPQKEAATVKTRLAHAETLYLAGRYAEARRMAERLLQEAPDDVRIRGFIATAAIQLGDRAAAEATVAWLRAVDPKYRFGYPQFAEAKIAALLGQADEAMRLLREAFARHSAAVADFSWEGLRMSPDFDSLRADPRFQEFVKPKG